ncbi:MAG: hypothetical protein WCA30_10230 [Dermatophilaceae bacterium]
MSIRSRFVSALAALLLSTSAAAAVAPAASAAPYCGIVWGSLAKSARPLSTGAVVGVRSGRHACFDRLVIDLRAASRPGYDVRYVSSVHADGSGAVVPLRGGAAIRVMVDAPAYDSQGRATYLPTNRRELVDASGYRTFRQAAWAGSFEGRTTIGLGVRARLPFRAFTLTDSATGTTRLVVDVAHRW